MLPIKQIESFHEAMVEYKNHLMECHGARDMIPAVMVMYERGGPIPLRLGQGYEAIKGPHPENHTVIRAMLEGMVASEADVARWTEEVDDDNASLETATVAVLRAVGAMQSLMARHSKPDGDKVASIWLAADTYVEIEARTAEARTLDMGELEADFKTNPGSTVCEAILTMVVSDDLCGGVDMQSIIHPYTVGDDLKLAWKDAEHCKDKRMAEGIDVDDIDFIPRACAEIMLKIVRERSL